MIMNKDKYQITIQDLYNEIWTISVSGVAKKYNLHYAKLLKKCKQSSIPIPPSGYWTQLSVGKKVTKAPLGVAGDTIVELEYADNKLIKRGSDTKKNGEIVKDVTEDEACDEPIIYKLPNNVLSFMTEIEKEQVIETIQCIPLYKNKRIHKVLREYKPQRKDNDDQFRKKQSEDFFNEVSEVTMKRIYILLDCIYYAIEKLGGKVNSIGNLTVRNFNIHFTIKEGQDNVPHKITKKEALELLRYKDSQKNGGYAFKPTIRKYDKEYNGKVTLKISYDNWVFRDKKNIKLEEVLPDIIVAFLEESENQRIIFEKRELERLKREEEEIEKQKKINIKKMENKKVKELLNIIEDMEIAEKIRKYANELKENEDLTCEEVEWIDWMLKKADWFDPIISREDEIYGVREHRKDTKEKNVYDNTDYWSWKI